MKLVIAFICLVAILGCEAKTYNVKEKNCTCNNCTCTDGHRCGPKCNCKPPKVP